MTYPVIEIDCEAAFQNAKVLRALCLQAGVEPTAVVKGFAAEPHLVAVLVRAGFRRLASSRLPHLRQIKDSGLAVETMALRIPMLSELAELVRVADISLHSELTTLCALDKEAAKQGRVHGVLLMRDLGDLREGLFARQALYALAETVERELPHLQLRGIGTNLTCYGSIIPTAENLGELVEDAAEIARRIGRKLEIVSGGSTSSLPLLNNGTLPAGITDLRIGEALIVPCDLLDYWGCALPLSNRVLLLKAEIIELGEKPTKPVGKQGKDAFGNELKYEDRGVQPRALLALGVLDTGELEKLIPLDPGLRILGGSSDHLIVDLENSARRYCIGDCMEFELHYKAMLFAMTNPLVEKKIVNEANC